MSNDDMKEELQFFVTTMPDTRPADYYLGCLEGSVYMDFDNGRDGRVRLTRISFDGYGCCNLRDDAIPMSEADSRTFREIIQAPPLDQFRLAAIVRKTISTNRTLIWEDALREYYLF